QRDVLREGVGFVILLVITIKGANRIDSLFGALRCFNLVPDFVANLGAQSIRGAQFSVVAAVVDGREHSEQRLVVPNADRGIILRPQQCRASGNQKKNNYVPGKQLRNQEGLPQRDWDEWISERSLRASLRMVKRARGYME